MLRIQRSLFVPFVAVFAACASASSDPAPEAAGAADESITNNQESGVDEGGIVKAAGDHLIVLRRGRLFTVELGDDSMTPVCMADAFAPGSRLGTWYDEMLVDQNQVVVIGYSYVVGATELGIFELSDDGCISHRDTYFLRSNDYYSTRNYASRLVDGELIFYMPHYMSGATAESLTDDTAPAFRAHDDSWRRIIESADIRLSSDQASAATLHTVVRCDLRDEELGCHAHGVIGGFGRTFYVSPNAVYVWVSDLYGQYPMDDELPTAELYRLPIDDSAPGAIRLWGVPTDQFSFKETQEGDLQVLVRNEGLGDWMGAPELGRFNRVALVSVPANFWTEGEFAEADWSMYTDLPSPDDFRPLQNRFVGDYVLYGVGATWWGTSTETGSALFAHDFRQGGQTHRIELRHDVGRIEALGDDAMVVGGAGTNLHFASIALGQEPHVVDELVEPGASQGELRSHGFFYKPRTENSGTLALPIRSHTQGYQHLYRGSAKIAFVDVDNLELSQLGSLDSTDDQEDDKCLVSCVDWYGNARPIFYRGRTFALLGYELVEGEVGSDQIREVGRVHLMGDQSEAQHEQLDQTYSNALDANPGYTPGDYHGNYYGCSAGPGGTSTPSLLLVALGLLALRSRRRRSA